MSLRVWIVLSSISLWVFLYLFWRLRFKAPSRTRIPILTYHQVSDRFDWSITRQKIGQFEKGIRSLYEQGYKTANLEETFTQDDDNNTKRVAITFDDGYEDFYQNAFPVLQNYNFIATIFIVTGYVGKTSDWDYSWGRYKKKHLSWRQIQELSSAGFSFGSHTVNHPDLTKIPKQLVNYELKRSKETLEEKLGKRIDFLSYPFGRYNQYVQQEAERLGYEGAFTLFSNSKIKEVDQFAQERWGVYLLDSPLTLRIKLEQGRLFWIEDMKGRIINQFPGWTIILKGSPDYDTINVKSTSSD